MDLSISRISNMPTVVNGVHESMYRSYGILRMVRELLEKNVPGEVILALIQEYGNAPSPSITMPTPATIATTKS